MGANYRTAILLASLVAICTPAWAQSSNRDTGWEYGLDLVYLGSSDLEFQGGSTADVEDDIAVAFIFGYRFNSRLELQFALDYQSVDYDATIQSADIPGLAADVRGEYESFTPRANVNYNFLDGNLTPYVTGGIGWSFIDTNIPEGRVEIGCWWDPWYGEICVPVQDTRSTDAFVYNLGAGVRWDASGNWSMRLGYEKHWYDLDNASGSPDFDQIKLGVVFRY
jgi:opacity protein-like surface antigen